VDIQKIEVSRLKAAEYNPRVALKSGDKEYEKLKRSIQEFGFVEPIIWNSRTGNVVGGHQRLTVLRDLGETAIDCVVVDLDERREKALNIALNKVQGSWDEDKLAALLSDLEASAFDVTMTGFDAAEVDELLNQFYSKEAVEDNFDVEKAHEDIRAKGAVTKRGDIWRLGEHLLMCGDSTDAADIARLMGKERAQVAVTSPPYCMNKEYEKKGIEAWFETIRPVIKNITKHADIVCWNIIDVYCTGTQFIEPTSVHSVGMFAEQGFRPIWIRIWKKQGINYGVGPYHLVTNKPAQQYEYITAFGNKAEPEYNDQEYAWVSAFAGHSYKFVKRLTKDERKKWGYAGIWEITTVNANKEHPAMFPVELPWRCIKMHSDKDGIVLEPFSGSGTTIIACEQAGRRCRAMEITPEYCDVAIRRFEEFTGQKAERIASPE
jgi:DNA modification methylase